MWAWVIRVAYLAGAMFANYLLKPSPEKPPKAEDDFPSADPNQSVAIVWGTVKVKPNIFWWGDKRALEYSRDGLFQGYTYYQGVAMGICWGPIDKLIDIIFNEDASLIRLAAQDLPGRTGTDVDPSLPLDLAGNEEGIDIELESQYLFGGPAAQGGIRGLMHFYFGTEDQEKNIYLDDRVNEIDPPNTTDTTPAYKRLCYAVFARGGLDGPSQPFYWGTTPTVKPVQFVVQRCPSGLNGDATSKIDNRGFFSAYKGMAANAAEIIYEIYTDQWWGLKKTDADMDVDSFKACADELFAENFGISGQCDSKTPAEDVIKAIEEHVDAVTYEDPTTGLITMRLLRFVFPEDVPDLPVVNSDNSSDLEFHRATFASLSTGVKVRWTDPDRAYAENLVDWQNQAISEATGEEATEEVDLPWLVNGYDAQAAAAARGRSITRPLVVARFKMNRLGHDFYKGRPFVLEYPEKGIEPVIMRVAEMDYGSFEDGQIEVSAVQDTYVRPEIATFLAGITTYAPPPPSVYLETWTLGFLGSFASTIGGVAAAATGFIGFAGTVASTIGGVASDATGTYTPLAITGTIDSEIGGVAADADGTVPTDSIDQEDGNPMLAEDGTPIEEEG